jgi:hypothetical protein
LKIARVKVKKYHEKIAMESVRKMSLSNDPERVTKHYDEVAKAVCENPPVGEIPVIYSTVFMIGLVGLVAAFFWTFVSIGWWGGSLVASLYLLTGLVPSFLKPKR